MPIWLLPGGFSRAGEAARWVAGAGAGLRRRLRGSQPTAAGRWPGCGAAAPRQHVGIATGAAAATVGVGSGAAPANETATAAGTAHGTAAATGTVAAIGIGTGTDARGATTSARVRTARGAATTANAPIGAALLPQIVGVGAPMTRLR